MFRILFFCMMVGSFFGLGACDLFARHWRSGVASILLGIVQMLVFWRKM
jgi:hypothetical protein